MTVLFLHRTMWWQCHYKKARAGSAQHTSIVFLYYFAIFSVTAVILSLISPQDSLKRAAVGTCQVKRVPNATKFHKSRFHFVFLRQ